MSDDFMIGGASRVKCTAVVGDILWGVDMPSGLAVVWDQRRAHFRVPTQQEQMGAEAYNARMVAEQANGSDKAREEKD